jgi:hypothetical protein
MVEMREMIQAGTVLFKEGTLLPEGLTFDREPYSPGWRSLEGLNGYAMDRKTPAGEWTFFYLAGEGRATAFGHAGQKTAGRAVKKILAGLKVEKCNSLEVTSFVCKAFLGMPYTTVSFHLRNLQEGMFLSGSQGSRPWKDAAFVAA